MECSHIHTQHPGTNLPSLPWGLPNTRGPNLPSQQRMRHPIHQRRWGSPWLWKIMTRSYVPMGWENLKLFTSRPGIKQLWPGKRLLLMTTSFTVAT